MASVASTGQLQSAASRQQLLIFQQNAATLAASSSSSSSSSSSPPGLEKQVGPTAFVEVGGKMEEEVKPDPDRKKEDNTDGTKRRCVTTPTELANQAALLRIIELRSVKQTIHHYNPQEMGVLQDLDIVCTNCHRTGNIDNFVYPVKMQEMAILRFSNSCNECFESFKNQ